MFFVAVKPHPWTSFSKSDGKGREEWCLTDSLYHCWGSVCAERAGILLQSAQSFSTALQMCRAGFYRCVPNTGTPTSCKKCLSPVWEGSFPWVLGVLWFTATAASRNPLSPLHPSPPNAHPAAASSCRVQPRKKNEPKSLLKHKWLCVPETFSGDWCPIVSRESPHCSNSCPGTHFLMAAFWCLHLAGFLSEPFEELSPLPLIFLYGSAVPSQG